MIAVVRVKLSGIPESPQPGDAIHCTVNDQEHDAEFVRFGSFERVMWVAIANLRETSAGHLVPDMFESFRDEFIRNADGTAYNGYWSGL